MSESRHTPGPWHKEDRRPSGWLIVPSDPDITGHIAVTSSVFRVSDGHEWLGNPDLLVAAPDMLKALIVAEDALADFSDDDEGIQEARQIICAAIAKATGEGDQQ